MSLLNSILSSINTGQEKPPNSSSTATASAAKTNPIPRKENGPLSSVRPQPSSITNLPHKPQAPVTGLPPKRKAEDVGGVNVKAPRVETAASLTAPPSRSATHSPAQRQGIAPPPKVQVPYRGTMGASRQLSTSQPARPVAGTSSAPITSTVAPKTGYLATLERAKAAQEAAKTMGQIKHKPVEKLTKKDRLKMQQEAAEARKGKAPAGRTAPANGAKPRSKSADPIDARNGPVKKERKPVDLGYKGTMRPVPAPLAYSGTMRSAGSAVPRKPQPGPSKGAIGGSGDRYRYASYSDGEEEDEEEEDYDSGSDMEAGLDEVDEEEELALRIARREDAQALKEENELKRQKLEKKRKLDQLAAAAKKKGARY